VVKIYTVNELESSTNEKIEIFKGLLLGYSKTILTTRNGKGCRIKIWTAEQAPSAIDIGHQKNPLLSKTKAKVPSRVATQTNCASAAHSAGNGHANR
jgi:hypothetical protein